MREIKVGIRISVKDGISFFGLEEVNRLIASGAKVTALQLGDALMTKVGEDGQNVRLVLSGCDLIVVVDDSSALNG
jgi:hypothetical protein